jgi:solute:Na+ symporter, SSS family
VHLSLIDVAVVVLFAAVVVAVSLVASRKERDSEDYFLAGRSLTWPLIGVSLLASNISTEHFVGMTGQGFGSVGLAIASYEWIAAVTLVAVAFFLLPKYLELGITTMPEFLERRFGPAPRTILSVYMLIAYVGVAIVAVLYSGALGLRTIFGVNLQVGIWSIGLLAGAYTVYGGLKAVVWSDLIQGTALFVGGATVSVLAVRKAGGWEAALASGADKLHMVLPADHPELPWTALLVGIWIPNFFYWGCNQFITQRALGARNLRQGQLGIVLAAWLKLAMPFLVVLPGILAYELYADRIADGDQAYAVLVQELLPAGLRGLFLAALFGAVMSSLDSMLNSASTIFTVDVYQRWLRPDADHRRLVSVGRWATACLVVLGCLLAPLPARFEGVFNYIQMIWGFVSPGVVVVFGFALVSRRTSALAASVGLLAAVPTYGLLLWLWPHVAFLNHMAVSAAVVTAIVLALTLLRPRTRGPAPAADREAGPPSALAAWLGIGAVLATVALYVRFW